MKQVDILNRLLQIEHINVAYKLGFTTETPPVLDESLAIESIGLIDSLSRMDDEKARKKVVTIAALLWTYKHSEWTEGLKDILILALSRTGFAPSARMVDEGFSKDTGTYSSMGSVFNQYAVALHHFQYEIIVAGKAYTVTKFQKGAWEKLKKNSILGLSAPTSAGKSFIILLKAIELLHSKDTTVVYIVPTLSLVSQVYTDFKNKIREFQLNNIRIHTNVDVEPSEGVNNIFILTQEKAISAFSYDNSVFFNTKILIVDEIQNIERVANEGDMRSKVLYDTLIEFRHNVNNPITVLSGPRIDSLKRLGAEIFGENQIIDEEKTKDSPVASITYAISKHGNNYYFDQYCESINKPLKIKIERIDNLSWYGKSIYQNDYYDFLSSFVSKINSNSTNIIFAPTSGKAVDIASEISKKRPFKVNKDLDSLSQYIKDTVNPQYSLADYIQKGIAYHHGKMPMHIRSAIEYAVQEKLIDDIACTTTLMQGVNLPVQNIVIRTPFLKIKKDKNGQKPQLTNYEIANLRGRAGRLLKDFIGRTYILDSSSFQPDDDTQTLFPETEKELYAGYGTQYKSNKKNIDTFLFDGKAVNKTLEKSSDYLVTYIRYVVLKYGEQAILKLNSVGIHIKEQELLLIKEVLDSLAVNKEVCLKNRYWDPMVINEIYLKRNNFSIPTGIASKNIEDKVKHAITVIKTDYPLYYEKYWRDTNTPEWAIYRALESWVKEQKLSSILSGKYYNESSHVEKCIELIQTNISYNMPALLKPIYDIKEPESTFLRFVEMGAYNPITRRLIELNIPREIAIELFQTLFRKWDQSNFKDIDLLEKLRLEVTNINKWMAIQIRNIL